MNTLGEEAVTEKKVIPSGLRVEEEGSEGGTPNAERNGERYQTQTRRKGAIE